MIYMRKNENKTHTPLRGRVWDPVKIVRDESRGTRCFFRTAWNPDGWDVLEGGLSKYGRWEVVSCCGCFNLWAWPSNYFPRVWEWKNQGISEAPEWTSVVCAEDPVGCHKNGWALHLFWPVCHLDFCLWRGGLALAAQALESVKWCLPLSPRPIQGVWMNHSSQGGRHCFTSVSLGNCQVHGVD